MGAWARTAGAWARAMGACAALAACGPADPASQPPPDGSAAPPPPAPRAAGSLAMASSPTGQLRGPPGPPPSAAAAVDPRPTPPAELARAALALGGESPETPCSGATEAERMRCLVGARWAARGDVRDVALELWDRHRVVVGLEADQWIDGGFRGPLHLVPEAPTGRHARHLAGIRDAHGTIARVLAAAAQRGAPAAPMRFRHEGIVYAFFRSVGRTTPSAYASSWRIGYNVSGSLLGTSEGVLETLFHEIVHLNDEGDRWSESHLRPMHDAIVARCGARSACLAPYAPTKTMVRGGTYYAFQPDNGDAVHEYAAEVATRWFLEHRAIVDGKTPAFPSAFKCGPEENGRAWRAVADAFFGGVDLVPGCPPDR